VNPNGFRLGVIKGWESRWYANRNYKDLVLEDLQLRQLIQKRLANAAVSRIEIERVAGTQISVTIHTAKPGIVIGKSGESVERLRQALEDQTKKKVRLSILEIRNPEVDATLIARSIAEQLEKRVSFRRAMKQSVQKAMRQGAKGIKVICGGRLGGAEIARTEKEVEGSVPLQTLRANIDYGFAEAHTTFGLIGIKVWVYHGEVLPEKQRAEGFNAARPVEPTEQGDRGRGPRHAGERRGDRPAPRAGGPRTGGGAPSGDRGPRRPAGTPGAAATDRPRTPRSAGAGAAPGPRGTARGTQPPQAQPNGEITPSEGPNLPSSGPVTPAPVAHEFPAPAANEPGTAPESETKAQPRTDEERERES
jgi:small subunit ribosomal protein S3